MIASEDAVGTTADFVSVEKELVEGLMGALHQSLAGADRRRLLSESPTESFQAFSAFGEGEAHRAAGDASAAKTAYERALTADPAYLDARVALDALSAVLESKQESRRAAAAHTIDAARQQVLTDVPDERTRSGGFQDTEHDLTMLTLRLYVLHHERRACDVYGEMDHFLRRRGWRVGEAAEPPVRIGRGLWDEMKLRGFEMPNSGWTVEPMEGRAVFLGQLVWAAARCEPPSRAVATVRALRAEVASRGLDSAPGVPGSNGNLGASLDFVSALVTAETQGASAELTRAAAVFPEKQVARILAVAEQHTRRRGVPVSELADRMELVAEGGLPSEGVCARAAEDKAAAGEWLRTFDFWIDNPSDPPFLTTLDAALPILNPLAGAGCFPGVAPRFATADAALTFYSGRHVHRSGGAESCDARWLSLDAKVATVRADRSPDARFDLDRAWATLVQEHCTDEG